MRGPPGAGDSPGGSDSGPFLLASDISASAIAGVADLVRDWGLTNELVEDRCSGGV